jgi:hypothetical protein
MFSGTHFQLDWMVIGSATPLNSTTIASILPFRPFNNVSIDEKEFVCQRATRAPILQFHHNVCCVLRFDQLGVDNHSNLEIMVGTLEQVFQYSRLASSK